MEQGGVGDDSGDGAADDSSAAREAGEDAGEAEDEEPDPVGTISALLGDGDAISYCRYVAALLACRDECALCGGGRGSSPWASLLF